MKRFAAALAAAVAWTAHAESPSDFAYRLPLSTAGNGAFFRVDVPPAVYEGALRADLSDVRVFNGDGAPVPLAFLAPPAAAREVVAPVVLPIFPLRVERDRGDLAGVMLTLRRDPHGTTVDLATRDGVSVAGDRLAGYLIDASELKAAPATLSLALPDGTNVSTRVVVEGSDDLATWRVLNASAPIVALEYGGRRLSLDRIDLAKGPAKYLRLSIAGGQPPLQIAGARGGFADRIVDAARQSRKVDGVPDGANTGKYVFDLGGAFPVDRITVELSEINTVAPVQVYARNDPKSEWRWVAAAVLYRLQQPDNSETTSPAFAVSSSPARYWKIAVDPRAGGVGAKPPTLVALWIPQALVFAARGTGPFELGYGSAQARPAALPIETLVPGFDAVTTPASFATATPGTPTVPPAMAALKQPIDAKRWLLWSALGLAAIVLAWMAYALSKQMRTPAADAKDAAASRAVGAVADSTTAGDGS